MGNSNKCSYYITCLNWSKKWSHGGGGVVVVVVVWSFLPIIEPPQSRLFNSGLNWVVAIIYFQFSNKYCRHCKTTSHMAPNKVKFSIIKLSFLWIYHFSYFNYYFVILLISLSSCLFLCLFQVTFWKISDLILHYNSRTK